MLFKSVAAAAVLSVGLAGGASAQTASPVVNHFVDMCADKAGDADAAIADAEALGWIALPEGALANAELPLDNLRVRMGSEGDTVVLLMVGDMAQEVEGTPMQMKACAVVAQPSQKGAAIRPVPKVALSEWIGMKSHRQFSQRDMTGYVFTVEDGRRQSMDNSSDMAILQAALSGRMNMVMAGEDDGTSILIYAIPRF